MGGRSSSKLRAPAEPSPAQALSTTDRLPPLAAGACYIRGSEAPAKLVLRDVVEMCKGVQHPTRGLFLRAYLVQAMRGLLPDTGSPYEGAGACGLAAAVRVWPLRERVGGGRVEPSRACLLAPKSCLRSASLLTPRSPAGTAPQRVATWWTRSSSCWPTLPK